MGGATVIWPRGAVRTELGKGLPPQNQPATRARGDILGGRAGKEDPCDTPQS